MKHGEGRLLHNATHTHLLNHIGLGTFTQWSYCIIYIYVRVCVGFHSTLTQDAAHLVSYAATLRGTKRNIFRAAACRLSIGFKYCCAFRYRYG